ncbi:MAG TPA: XdhC family protein [Saprospiraceae bacterium]|nr:XdhC family protein [Saprospiraceae bacterium]HMP25089.1 XdhC family protein [Saprospiraceae bacterium]
MVQEVFSTIEDWLSSDKRFAVATVIGTWGSSPRPVGSVLLVREDGAMAGSVSGGCVENAVVKSALQVLASGVPQALHFGITNDEAWAVGLSCGGKLDVWVEPFPTGAVQEQLLAALRADTGGLWLSRLDEGHYAPVFLSPAAIAEAHPDWAFAYPIWRERRSQVLVASGERWFVRVVPRKNRLLIIGAAHIAVELVRLAHLFDFATTVIDPRQVFATKTQFAEAPHDMLVNWPAAVLPTFELDAWTYAVLLSHDPKIDDQALHLLLRSEIGYIGALGSRRTHEQRIARLRAEGFSDAAIARIHAPVGLSIGAQGAREIAVSIIAEMIQYKNSGTD